MNKQTIIPTRCFYDVSFPLAQSRRAATMGDESQKIQIPNY